MIRRWNFICLFMFQTATQQKYKQSKMAALWRLKFTVNFVLLLALSAVVQVTGNCTESVLSLLARSALALDKRMCYVLRELSAVLLGTENVLCSARTQCYINRYRECVLCSPKYSSDRCREFFFVFLLLAFSGIIPVQRMFSRDNTHCYSARCRERFLFCKHSVLSFQIKECVAFCFSSHSSKYSVFFQYPVLQF